MRISKGGSSEPNEPPWLRACFSVGVNFFSLKPNSKYVKSPETRNRLIKTQRDCVYPAAEKTW